MVHSKPTQNTNSDKTTELQKLDSLPKVIEQFLFNHYLGDAKQEKNVYVYVIDVKGLLGISSSLLTVVS